MIRCSMQDRCDDGCTVKSVVPMPGVLRRAGLSRNEWRHVCRCRCRLNSRALQGRRRMPGTVRDHEHGLHERVSKGRLSTSMGKRALTCDGRPTAKGERWEQTEP